MREGPIADPEQRKELEGYLEQSLANYGALAKVMRGNVADARRTGDQAGAERQAQRLVNWDRQVKATQATLDTLRTTGEYRIRHAADAEFNPVPSKMDGEQ